MFDVKLLSWTAEPVKTLYTLWEASRSTTKLAMIVDEYTREKGAALFTKLLSAQIPVIENINFVFLLENIPISFREQLVRHRIGVVVGSNYGVDVIPDLTTSVYWSQSMRILPMDAFSEDQRYYIPPEVESDPAAREQYRLMMEQLASTYSLLRRLGVSMEQAREILPLAATHRISWTLNLASLLHIIGKRGCWILQSNYWFPIIAGMLSELNSRVDPLFSGLTDPPCFESGEFRDCRFRLDNERREQRLDMLPPCPLWATHCLRSILSPGVDESSAGREQAVVLDLIQHYGDMLAKYRQFWGRDPFTGVVDGLQSL